MATISDIRHANLLLLIARAGTIQRFATQIGRSHSQVSQLKNKHKRGADGSERVMGDDLARDIEKKLQLGEGWMDTPQAGGHLNGSALWQRVGTDGAIADRKTIAEFAARSEPPAEPAGWIPGLSQALRKLPQSRRGEAGKLLDTWANSGGNPSYIPIIEEVFAGHESGSANSMAAGVSPRESTGTTSSGAPLCVGVTITYHQAR